MCVLSLIANYDKKREFLFDGIVLAGMRVMPDR